MRQRKQDRETHDKLNVSVFVHATARYMNPQSRYHILVPPDKIFSNPLAPDMLETAGSHTFY